MLLNKAAQPDIIKLVDGKVFEALVNNDEVAGIRTRHQVIDTGRQKDKTRVRFIDRAPQPEPGAVAVNATLEDAYLFLTQNNN